MELGTLEREIYIDASPEVVFEVMSRPEHVRCWWPDDASYELRPGADGTITFGDPADGGAVVTLSPLEIDPPHSFSFRWTHPAGTTPAAGNSLLVTFQLQPSGGGTLLKLTETGFREMGWSPAEVEREFREHADAWTFFLGRLAPYAATLEVDA